MQSAERSFETIELDDLRRLVPLALRDLDALFHRRPESVGRYRDRLFALALGQGAAEHFVRPGRGVKDFDIWAFFRPHPAGPFPYRRRGIADFGDSKFGRGPEDVGCMGRRVDVLGRDIPIADGEAAVDALTRYLAGAKTESARLLAKRPLVLIHPDSCLGQIVWDPLRDLDTHHRDY